MWWVPDWDAASPFDWARWAITREPWSETATMDEWLYLGPDAANLARRGDD